MTEPIVLVARSAKKFPSVAEGSTKEPCSKCGVKVWATPSIQALLEKRKVRVVCRDCGATYIRPQRRGD